MAAAKATAASAAAGMTAGFVLFRDSDAPFPFKGRGVKVTLLQAPGVSALVPTQQPSATGCRLRGPGWCGMPGRVKGLAFFRGLFEESRHGPGNRRGLSGRAPRKQTGFRGIPPAGGCAGRQGVPPVAQGPRRFPYRLPRPGRAARAEGEAARRTFGIRGRRPARLVGMPALRARPHLPERSAADRGSGAADADGRSPLGQARSGTGRTRTTPRGRQASG